MDGAGIGVCQNWEGLMQCRSAVRRLEPEHFPEVKEAYIYTVCCNRGLFAASSIFDGSVDVSSGGRRSSSGLAELPMETKSCATLLFSNDVTFV